MEGRKLEKPEKILETHEKKVFTEITSILFSNIVTYDYSGLQFDGNKRKCAQKYFMII